MLLPTAHFTHSLPALVFAAQSPYPGCQTVAYSRERYVQLVLSLLENYKIKNKEIPLLTLDIF
jgi:hypothetical protein